MGVKAGVVRGRGEGEGGHGMRTNVPWVVCWFLEWFSSFGERKKGKWVVVYVVTRQNFPHFSSGVATRRGSAGEAAM